MAGAWIKFEHVTPDKPEIVAMADILKIDQDAVTGKCLRIWIWADQNTTTGQDLEVQDSFIDRLTHCPGFSAALRKVGWLHGRTGRLVIPNFDRHNGQSAKSRALAKDRQEETRDTRKVETISMLGHGAEMDADQNGGRRSVIPRELRVRIYQRDGYRCCYCGWHKNDPQPLAGKMVGLRRLSLDHITPFCQGGQETEDNLITACLACNMQKSGRSLEEAGMEIMFGPLSPLDNSVTNPVLEIDKSKRENKKPPIVPRKKNHPFQKSPFYPFENFRAALPEWSEAKCRHYFDRADGYSEAKGATYANWVRAVQNWDREKPWRGSIVAEGSLQPEFRGVE